MKTIRFFIISIVFWKFLCTFVEEIKAINKICLPKNFRNGLPSTSRRKLFEDEQFYKRVMSEMAKAMYLNYRNDQSENK